MKRVTLIAGIAVLMLVLAATTTLMTLARADGEGSIGDYVWLDDGQIVGLQEAGERGINDVDLQLWLDDGDSIFSDTLDSLLAANTTITNPMTGKGGWYYFSDLAAGTYFVGIALSEFDAGGTLWEYGPTVPDVGTDDTADSDGNNPTCPYSSTVGTGECGQIGFENNVLVAVTLSEVDGEVESATDIDFGVVVQEPPTAVTVTKFNGSAKRVCPGGAVILIPFLGFLWTARSRRGKK